MKYNISFSNPNSHFIEFKLTFEALKANTVLHLPNWRPGRYQIQNFAKRIKYLKAFDETHNEIEVNKVDKSSWQLKNKPGLVSVVYEYYAFEMDAGNSWLDDQQLYINFINCTLYTEDSLYNPYEIHLDLPDDYEVACGLEQKDKHKLISPSYYQLVDSPLIASASLRKASYTFEGCIYYIWIQGEMPKSDKELITDFIEFTKTQVKVMGSFPCSDYHFLCQCLPYKHYHGVEHWNSTVITIGPSSELGDRKLYKEFLGISSHELFHTWNVIRLRPKEMTPYNFQNENYHRTGFITEGVTTYYGDLFLARSGVFRFEEYLGELNKLLKRHFENEGRSNMSVADSSFDLWLDGYEKGIPGKKVSIYNEGALAALILDLTIRLKFDNQKSLDDVIRLMWNRHGEDFSGYSYMDYKNAAESIYEAPLDDYFKNIVSGTQPYEDYLCELLPAFGLSFDLVESEKILERDFGFKLEKNKIVAISSTSPAECKLSLADEIETINGKSIEAYSENENELNLVINRFGRKVKTTLKASKKNHFSVYHAEDGLSEQIQNSQHQLLKGWLEKCIE